MVDTYLCFKNNGKQSLDTARLLFSLPPMGVGFICLFPTKIKFHQVAKTWLSLALDSHFSPTMSNSLSLPLLVTEILKKDTEQIRRLCFGPV